MDKSLFPPHLNAEVYTTYDAKRGKIQYYDYIHMHLDGTVLLGSTDFTGRYWDGNISIFQPSGELLGQILDDKYSVRLKSSSADGCFIGDSDKVLLCEDSGAISVWKKSNNQWTDWQEEIKVTEHDSNIMAVDCVEDGKSYVTVGADGHMKIWDVNDLICIRNYDSAHEMMIFDVSVRPNSTTNIATGSLDRNIYLWDENVNKLAADLLESDCGVRCVKWLNEHILLFGNEDGYLGSIDVRQPGKHTFLMNMIAPVHRIIVKPESHHVAVCCNNRTVTVLNMNEDTPQVLYQDNKSHTAYIRGLSWDVKDDCSLHTVGWDGVIKTHKYL